MAADLTIVNGRILGAEGADAVRVRDGRIEAVGRAAEVGRAGEMVDARGGLVLPGFDDAHIHVRSGARSMGWANLYPLGDVARILDAVRAHAADHPGDAWVRGRGWLYAPFPGGLPTRELLDGVVPDRPALMRCYDGHTSWANTAALRFAGIDRTTPDPPNGIVVRDEAGEPTGAFKEEAQDLVERHIPAPTHDEDRAAVAQALAAFHAAGITAAQDASLDPEELAFWTGLDDEGRLDLRFRGALIMEPGQTLAEWRDRLDAYEAQAFPRRGGVRLDAGILKGFVDGVIEARTASMLAPYEANTSSGLPAWEPGDLDAFVAEADRRGWQVELDAIGDHGVRLALDAFEHAARANGPWAGDPHGRHPGRDPRPPPPRRAHRDHRPGGHPALRRPGRRRVDAAVPRRPEPQPGDAVGRQHRPRAGEPGVGVAVDPPRRRRARVRVGLAGRAVRPDRGAQQRGQPPDASTAGPRAGGCPGSACRWRTRSRRTPPGRPRRVRGASARPGSRPGLDADLIVLDRDLLTAGPSAIIGTGVRLTVLGGRVVHRSEG